MLNNLTIGYTNARRLLIADGIQFLLKSHNQFEFISSNDLGIMRSRTSFYEVLMRILNIEIEGNLIKLIVSGQIIEIILNLLYR